MKQVNPPEPDVQSQDEKFLEELRAVIEKNLSDPDFNIDTLCRILLIGRSDFFNKVKKVTGETPNQYIKSYRLERAVQLFEKNYGNVTEVAMAVGFSTTQYFATCFYEKFNQSPTDYLRSQLKNISDKSQGKRNGLLVIDIPSKDEMFLEKLRVIIEENLSNPDFNVNILYKKLRTGRATLFRKIKAVTGKTPREYIKSYRLERAVQLFEKNYGNVTEVAMAVGFDTPQYFSTCFNEKFGQSPTNFLNSLHQKNIEGTPHREEIFKQVMHQYNVYSVVKEALEYYTELEFVKKLRKMIQEKMQNVKK